MYLNLANKYKWLAINASLISCTYLRNKFNVIFCNSDNSRNSRPNFSFKNYTFTTLNKSNNNLDPNNPNRKVDNKIIKMIKEYREAVLFEDYADLFVFSDEMISGKEKEYLESNPVKSSTIKKKQFEEETLIVGDENIISNRSFIQVNLDKLKRQRNSATDEEEEDLHLNDPERYFQKILIFKINDIYYATSSFCGYDLTDLKTGILLGNKLICPNCLSEYNIENGFSEAGPNIRHLATFPVGFRRNKIQLRIPKGRVPLFSLGPVADINNELDPRHFIIIGDNETAFGAVDYLTKVYSGKISIISHQTGNNFVDRNKLYKSFFPLKIRHSQFINKNYLETFKINYYDEKVVSIDGIKRLVNLSSGNKIPFDKVLIAVGSKYVGMETNHKNSFKLNTIKDHAAIHNEIIKPEVKSIAMIGNTMKIFEMASSMRRYLDAIDKKDAKIYIISPDDKIFLHKFGANEVLYKMVVDYLGRNNIFVFRSSKDLNFEENKEENKIKKAEIVSDKLVFKLPADIFIFDSPLLVSNLDFINKIIIRKGLTQDSFKQIFGNIIIPDERMSLHSGDQYAHIFTAGSCSAFKSYYMEGLLRTDNIKTNFHLGYIAALNMLEVHYPYDDVIVNQAKILDKNVAIIGEDTVGQYDDVVTYVNPDKNQFIIYLFRKQKMTQIVMYGFDRFHVYLKEAMRYKMLPDFEFVSNHRNDAHQRIIEEMVRRQDMVECFKHKTFNHTANIDTTRYSVEDQAYAEDITKRNMNAYNLYKEAVDQKYANSVDEKRRREYEKQQRMKQSEERGKI